MDKWSNDGPVIFIDYGSGRQFVAAVLEPNWKVPGSAIREAEERAAYIVKCVGTRQRLLRLIVDSMEDEDGFASLEELAVVLQGDENVSMDEVTIE